MNQTECDMCQRDCSKMEFTYGLTGGYVDEEGFHMDEFEPWVLICVDCFDRIIRNRKREVVL